MRILSVGSLSGISNTCVHRNEALHKIATVDEVNIRVKPMTLWGRIAYHLFLYGLPIREPENNTENEQIKRLVKKNHYDIVWIDKGNTIYASTLKYIKSVSPDTIIVSYSPDNIALRHNQSQQYLECIPLYDYHLNIRSNIIEKMKSLGARNYIVVSKGYSKDFHYPRDLSDADIERLGGDVGFVGSWEQERCESICYLADHGVSVKVFGTGKWKEYVNYSPNLHIILKGLYDDDYVKSFKAFKISLCFLRKMNFDQFTSRTFEIPACGGFMVAERTDDHKRLFKEDKEAVFFSSNEELLDKCKYYLAHEEERIAIAKAGRLRCETSDYSDDGVIKNAINQIIIQHGASNR